jgi:hypothetical protein
MKMKILLLASATLVGCAHTVWYQPGVTQDQANQDMARAKLLYSTMHPAEYNAAGAISQSIEAGNFVDNYMVAHGYQKVPASQATNYPVRLGNHVD